MTIHYSFQSKSAARPIEVRLWRLWMAGSAHERGRHGWRPPTNVFEVEGGIVVQAEIAGLRSGDCQVVFRDGRLSIWGVRREPASGRLLACRQMEIPSGSFRTDVLVAGPVRADEMQVEYRDGFLTVTLPRGAGPDSAAEPGSR